MREALACLDNFTESITSNLDSADWSTRREILRTLIDRVLIEPDQIRIVYRINFPLFAKKLAMPATEKFCTFVGGATTPPCCYPPFSVGWTYHRPALRLLERCRRSSEEADCPSPIFRQAAPRMALCEISSKNFRISTSNTCAPLGTTAHQLVTKRGQRVVCRSARTEPVRAVQEVLFVDRFQQHDDRTLEEFILQRGILLGASPWWSRPSEYALVAQVELGRCRISRGRASSGGCPPGSVRIPPRITLVHT